MNVTRTDRVVVCAVCERTLLLGETVTRFQDGRGALSVCPLCVDAAVARGWRREGAPVPPPAPREERPGGIVARLLRRAEAPAAAPVVTVPRPPATPALPPRGPERQRRLGEERQRATHTALAAGLQAFNRSEYRRTMAGIARSLGRPRVSVVPLGGLRPDVVVTVAWELSWYQYRVDPAATPAVRLEGRGDDPGELEGRWRDWNARTGDDGAVELA